MTPGTRRLITASLFALIAALPLATITGAAAPPQWGVRIDREGQEGDTVTIAFLATDPEGKAVTYSVAPGSALPAGLQINPVTGLVSGTLRASTPNPDIDNGPMDGAAGQHTVVLRATDADGEFSNHTFTWRVSRFRKGDVFAGIGGGRYRVFDENGIAKYTLTAETMEEWEASGSGDGSGTTTGCGYNWVSKKMYFTSFDVDHDPTIAEIDPVPVAGGSPFPRTRISTFRDSGLAKSQPATGRSIDNAPESVTFDKNGNMYVGHAGGYYDIDWLPADNQERPLITFGAEGDPYLYYINAAGQLLLSNGASIPYAQGKNAQGVLEKWPGQPWPGSPVALEQWGRDVAKLLYNPSTGGMTPSAVFDVQTGWQGSDWLDLSSDQRTIFYTSEWGVIYQYDVGAVAPAGGRQLTPFIALPGNNGASPTLYAIRLLPPGDGSGGLLVAAETQILRISADGRMISHYDAPGVDGWFALNIAPDGRSFWSADPETNKIYKFDIANGAILRIGQGGVITGVPSGAEPTITDELGNPRRYSLDGLCVMGEYTAAQEVCGNGADDDADGLIDEVCQPIEACTNQSPGDDDGDGLVDSNDPDCGAVNICAASGFTDASVAGYCARFNYEGDAAVVLPAPGPTPQSGLRETYTITGSPSLPPGITFDANGMATGTAAYTSVLNTQAAPKQKVYRITIVARREKISDGTFVSTYTQSFDWTIENKNRIPVAVDDSRTIRPGQTATVNVLTNDSDADAEDVLSITSPTPTLPNGTLTKSGSTYSYTPNSGFLGTESFLYTIADGYGGTATARVTFKVVNVAPIAIADERSIRPGGTVAISVLTNDTDADGDTLVVTGNTNPSHGTVSRNTTTHVLTYTGAAGYVGTDTFTYTISDGFGGTATGTVTITSTNTPPVAVNDSAIMIAGGPPIQINVRANDPADQDGDTVTITSFTQPANGTVTNNNGVFTFTPANGFSGATSFTYTISDGYGGVSTATVSILVRNLPPVAINDTATTAGTRPVAIAVMANDSEPDNHVIAVSGATTPANGTAIVNANGTITYTANAGFQGTDTFFYTIRDGFGGESTAQVSIAVGPPNRFDPCLCASAKASPGEIWPPNHKQTVVVNVTNLVDPNGDPVAIKILGIYQDEPTNYLGDGTTTIDAGGVGTSSAWVRAERTGNPNVPGNGRVYEIVFEATARDGSRCQGSIYTGVPHDQGQGNYIYDDGIRYDSTVAGGPVVRNALKVENNLSDADVTARQFVPKYQAEARIGGTGGTQRELLIGPATGASADTEDFTWTSGEQVLFLLWRTGSQVYFKLATDTQYKYVSYVVDCANGDCNDIFIRGQAGGTGKITLSSLNINGLAMPDTLTIPVGGAAKSLHLSGLALGEGMLLGGLAKIEWTVTRPANNTVNFQVRVGKACPTEGGTGGGGGLGTPPLARTDGYATLEDTPITVAAPGVLLNDLTFAGALSASIVDTTANGTLVLNANGSFTYTPNAQFNGQDTFRYRVNDGSLYSEPALVTIVVASIPDLPNAVNDSATTNERTAVAIPVTANDSDFSGAGVTLTAVTQPSHGTATISGATAIYTPATGFVGVDTFTYTVTGAEGVATATVTVTVLDVNEPPVAVNDSYTTAEDTALTIATPGVKTNDSDPDTGDTFNASVVTAPAHGTVTLNANGSFTYTPAANYTGADSFTYRVRDTGGLDSNVATVSITITPVNDPPTAVNDSYVVSEDGALQINAPGVKSNDTDPDTAASALTVTMVSGPTRGALTLNADGSFLYTPFPNTTGTDSFVYRLSDGTASSTATATIAITEVPDPPVAVDDAVTTNEDTAVTINVVGNDSDPDTTVLTLQSVTQPPNGTVTIVAGQARYTPRTNFNGTDSFSYVISDGTTTATAKVVVTVTPVNDAPSTVADSYTTARNTVLNVPTPGVLINDSDPDAGQTLTAKLVTNPTSGTVVLQTGGSFSYTPANNFTGTATFTYRASDGTVDGNIVTVTITVTSTTRPPVAVNDTYSTGKNTALTVAAPGVLSNDSDPDETDTISAILISAPPASAGTLTLNANGSFTFTPANNYTGTTSFRYRARDNANADSNEAIATIEVKASASSGQVCYDGGSGSPDVRALLVWSTAANGDVTARASVSRNYADNTYGVNHIGWGNKNHNFAALYRSDFARLAFYDSNGVNKIDFKIDNLSPKAGTPSGYGSLGVGTGTNADGGMVSGSAANIVSMMTSADLNMNAFGYVTTAANHPLKTYSPPTNSSYTPNATYPLWIWDVWYEATVKGSTFGSAGLGYVRMPDIHASPSKKDAAWRVVNCS